MPKVKATGLPSAEPTMDGGGNFYDGPLPPKGTYSGIVKKCRVKENSNGDLMLNILVELKSYGEKKKYNGFGAWGNINLTESGAPFARRFAESVGARYADFQNMMVDDEEPANVLKLGRVKLTGEEEVVITLRPNFYQGNETRQIGIFLPHLDEEDRADEGDSDDEDEPF